MSSGLQKTFQGRRARGTLTHQPIALVRVWIAVLEIAGNRADVGVTIINHTIDDFIDASIASPDRAKLAKRDIRAASRAIARAPPRHGPTLFLFGQVELAIALGSGASSLSLFLALDVLVAMESLATDRRDLVERANVDVSIGIGGVGHRRNVAVMNRHFGQR